MSYNYTQNGLSIQGVSDDGKPNINIFVAKMNITNVSRGYNANSLQIVTSGASEDRREILVGTGFAVDGVVATDLDDAIVKMAALITTVLGTDAPDAGLIPETQYNSDALAKSAGGLIIGEYYVAGADHIDGTRQGSRIRVNA